MSMAIKVIDERAYPTYGGVCGICSQVKIMRHHDSELGWICPECILADVNADELLQAASVPCGLRRPTNKDRKNSKQ